MVEASHYPLKLMMVLNKTTFKVGEPINITFIIENIGNETLTLFFTDGVDRESFVVYDEAGSQVYEDIHYYPAVHIPFMLPPSLSTSLTPTWYQNLPLGSYKIVGLFISGSLGFTLETQPVTITIEETGGGGVMVEAVHFPLRLTMVLNKTTFEFGEPVNMTFQIENIGNETLTFHYHGGADHFSFVVYDKSGSKVYEPDRAWLALYMPPTPVPPGLALVTQDTWYQQYNPIFRGWDEDPLYEYRKVSPGTYQIVGLFISHTLNFTIETPPVTITILGNSSNNQSKLAE